jgi:hypothetical protein
MKGAGGWLIAGMALVVWAIFAASAIVMVQDVVARLFP